MVDMMKHIADENGRRAAWLEDALAGLLAAGVRQDEIEVREHPGLRTVVAVRGAPRYEYTMVAAPSFEAKP